MSTLFFEGFDKGVVLNELDSTYWSTQYKAFPKYAFGGYTPITLENRADPAFYYGNDSDPVKLSFVYNYSTPEGINGLVPTGRYVDDRAYFSYYSVTYFTKNSYPGFGSPVGFLAFTNIDIENPSNLETPTYLQASGFPTPSGNISYLSMRCLGLESKNSDYSIYPYRHTLFSYNSGNLPLLTVNIVKITGNNLSPINNIKTTLALEIQQNNQTLGYFDLNISGLINRYKISSVFNTTNNKILTITDTNAGPGFSAMISRWAHLEFSVDQSSSPPLLYINLEDINLSVVNPDSNILKSSWDLSLPISGFNFNNLRFYNRTYSSSVMNGIAESEPGQASWKDSWYYMQGRTWLLDDLILIDNTDPPPSFWLSSSAKVMSIFPGCAGSLVDNATCSDGLLKWSLGAPKVISNNDSSFTDFSSHRRALLIPDADGNNIETIASGNINAIKMSQPNYLQYNTFNRFDSNSVWRTNFNDTIGGMKIYNSSRKKYLDTKFINVMYSGASDIYEPNVTLLLHGESSPIVDSSTYLRPVSYTGTVTSNTTPSKIGSRSIGFGNQNSYLYLNNYPDLSTSPFTIESWVYFPNNSTSISLFDKMPLQNTPLFSFRTYSFAANISGIQYLSTFAYVGDDGGVPVENINSPEAMVKRQLFFPSTAATGVWHHVAITRNSSNKIICYLNGEQGNSYYLANSGNISNFVSTLETTGTFNTTYSPNLNNSPNIYSEFFSDGSNNVVSNFAVIGKGGYIDEYRITSGIARYDSNFTPSNEPFKTKIDDYVEIGPEHSVNKTTYKTYQYYMNKNPITQQNWLVSEVSGIIFGVKKL